MLDSNLGSFAISSRILTGSSFNRRTGIGSENSKLGSNGTYGYDWVLDSYAIIMMV